MKKPLHKHIAYHVRKYHRHFTKYLYERDTVLATISVFIFLILLGLIPINFYVLNPLKLALKDFDFNDIAYAKLEKSAELFRDFMKSSGGGNLKEDNVFCLLNEDAKAANFWVKGMSWLK